MVRTRLDFLLGLGVSSVLLPLWNGESEGKHGGESRKLAGWFGMQLSEDVTASTRWEFSSVSVSNKRRKMTKKKLKIHKCMPEKVLIYYNFNRGDLKYVSAVYGDV